MKLPVRLAHGCWLLFRTGCIRSATRRVERGDTSAARIVAAGSYQWNGSTPHESAWVCGLEITRWNGGVDAYGNP